MASLPTILGFREWLDGRVCKEDRGFSSRCWVWQLATAPNGYARTKLPGNKNRTIAAHRLAYETLVGPIGASLELDHLCRVRECCNPSHLEPVTHAENLRRGTSNKPQSHCRRGHPFVGDNVLTYANGTRTCRTCNAAWHKAHPRSSRA